VNQETSALDRSIIAASSADDRQHYLIDSVGRSREIWILRDDDGFVMMQSEDERCVPVWPDEAFARDWATGEWADCRPMSVDLAGWRERWTTGLERDGIQVAVFPSEDDDVVVLTPEAFAEVLPPA
jgi:hypothetical protein